MAKKTGEIKTASVLAFERKMDPSDGVMSSGSWDERSPDALWPAIPVHEKRVRGTISNRKKAKDADPAKLDAEIRSPNPQHVDVAALPSDSDTMALRFSVRFIPGTGTPSACNESGYQEKLVATVGGYAQREKFQQLSLRYATNFANGKFLWRNFLGAENVEVHVQRMVNGKADVAWVFDAVAVRSGSFPSSDSRVVALAEAIAKALRGEQHLLLQVVAFVRLGVGQEVYPSQELILDKGTAGKGQKSKTLYRVGDAAGVHSQKIGNALRTIDTWYPDADKPIAVEPYGSVTSEGRAYRQPKEKQDFYTLLDDWVLRDKVPPVEQQHYVIANLIRGGVFGEAEK